MDKNLNTSYELGYASKMENKEEREKYISKKKKT